MGEKDRMRPTKMLPVHLSLREVQELDTSAQALQSQLRPHHVFWVLLRGFLIRGSKSNG
jgi:hypothetical protein